MNTFTTPRASNLFSNDLKPESSLSNYSADYLSFRQTSVSTLFANPPAKQACLNFRQPKALQEVRSPRNIMEQGRTPKLRKNDVHLLMRMNSIAGAEVQSEANACQMRKPLIISSSRQAIKPKIYFSYNKYEGRDGSMRLANAISQVGVEQCGSPQLAPQLKLIQRKLRKNERQKKLKIISSAFHFNYTPKTQNKTYPRQSFIQQSQNKNQPNCLGSSTSINSVSYIHNNGDALGREAKSSKMASTQITQSFSMDSRKFDFSSAKETDPLKILQKYDASNHKSAKNIFQHQYTTPSLLDSLATSKNLKKTVIENNYTFGGIFLREPEIRPSVQQRAVPQAEVKESNTVWKTLMSGLFHGEMQDDNLKKSIYCGPEKRHESLRCDILSGFGRQMAESSICPEQ